MHLKMKLFSKQCNVLQNSVNVCKCIIIHVCYSSGQKEITGLTNEKDSLTTTVFRLTEVVKEGKQAGCSGGKS